MSRSRTSSGSAGPLHDVDQAPVRAARQLRVQQRLVLLADALDEVEAQPDAPARGHLRRPAVARLGRRDDAGRRADRLGPGGDPGAVRQRLARPAHPFGRRLVGRGVDVDRQHRHAVALGVVDEDLDRVEAHRLGVDEPDQELGRVEQLQEGRFVGGPGERGRVGLGEPEARERGDLAEQLLGHLLGHAGLAQAALEELPVELLHLAARAPRPHRPPEPVRFGRGEAADLDGDPHDLLLVEDHAHRILEDRLQARMEVGHRLEALLAAQERVDGVALDRARPDDRHLDHEVVEALRARLRERLHLGPALDLEDPHGVGRLEHLEDLRDVLGQAVQVEADRAVVLDELERLVHRGEHPEPEQVELDELERLDVALVELDDDAIDHRRALDRGDVDERRRGHQHPARMDREVAREAVDPGAELEPALPVREPDRRAAAGLGRRLGLDPGDRGVGGRGALVGAARRRRIPAAGPAELVGRAALGRSSAAGPWPAAAARAGRSPDRPAGHR